MPETTTEPFWRVKTLREMSPSEWESLCDGCGKCCLHKLQYEDTDEIYYTDVACRLLDLGTCQCSKYAERQRHVPDCVALRPDKVMELNWLPSTCAYRLVANGQPLAWWHPLVSGDPNSVHAAGQSVLGRAVPEKKADILDHHIVTWPA
ncbi:YcgN family cysteine cluster protein [Telmatospirillum sp.]|uniref:YcgN family cysteine cluster protein n=1 Tax=Telmatospirillum sp. TaxID=2079197 RepID=UPI00283B0DBA|nr:YcgN family cysteine cluster protein [Telmatospirillum sp.]MDR3437547.1 YcgN family cysteine cluster protein [Telmatospirillum sp.]